MKIKVVFTKCTLCKAGAAPIVGFLYLKCSNSMDDGGAFCIGMLVFCLFCACAAFSTFLFRNIFINDGLSQNSVISTAADETGFIWFATQDWLSRFDGKEFLILKMSFDDIATSRNSRRRKIFPYGV